MCTSKSNQILAYILPFGLYLVGTSLIASASVPYPVGYSAVVAVVGVVSVFLLMRANVLRPHWRIVPGVIVGIVGIAIWIAICELRLEEQIAVSLPSWLQPQPREAFNPFASIADPVWAWAFVAVRITGLAILVPVAEELFWRGFLLRWLENEDWQTVRIGAFGWQSGLIVTALFTLAHPEWFAAFAYCSLLNGFLWWKQDLWGCIVAHAVSNLSLAIYILATGAWLLW